VRHSQRHIALFWVPLAATWLMMAFEGPFLAAVIARLPDETFNLAAHGVAFAFAILIEAPVIMLMSAATALVEDRESYVRLRVFGRWLGFGSTGLLLFILIPPVYGFLMYTVVGLPEPVAELTYGALWLFLPWPGAIGYRRFLQGVLIRAGRTRLVAYGTIVRLITMAAAALFGFHLLDIPGAWVGAMSLSVGVVAEAGSARWMARHTVREVLATSMPEGKDALSFREIAHFYYPLALTSLIGLTVQPMLTFFMGRAPAPVESLAVFPVVHALLFVFRSLGLAFQDAAIALMGERHRHLPELGTFTALLGGAATAVLALVTFTPLADVWFVTISGLTPELSAFAYVPARIMVPLAALSVILSLQRAILVNVRRTRPITVATAIEVLVIAAMFPMLGWGVGVVGVTAAFIAFVAGRACSNVFLAARCTRVVREYRSAR
jgi:Na+-driven multidrug efflux pump